MSLALEAQSKVSTNKRFNQTTLKREKQADNKDTYIHTYIQCKLKVQEDE